MHSDQRVHYQHRSWRAILAAADATRSMSRKGDRHENAVIENPIGHLKAEMFNPARFATITELTYARGLT